MGIKVDNRKHEVIIIKDQDIQKRIRRKKRRFKIFFLLIITSIIVIFIFRTPVFKVRNIVVKGNNIVEEQILKELSGINIGDNLLKINIRNVSENILTCPYIEDIKVKRSLFGTIQIIVNERQSAGIIEYENKYVTIDKKGVVIEVVDSREGISLPLVQGLNIKEAKPGKILELQEQRKIEAFNVIINNISTIGLFDIINEVDINNILSIIIRTNNGINIKLGSTENIEYKLKVSKAIMENDVQKKGLKGTIDVSFNGNPVFKQE